jgi:hypothetical protein
MSMLISCLYLGIMAGVELWKGCLLIILGSTLPGLGFEPGDGPVIEETKKKISF